MNCVSCGTLCSPSVLMSPRCDTCREFEPHGFTYLNHQLAGGRVSVPVLPSPVSLDVVRFPHSVVAS